jgi:hypothetical protein
MHPKYLKQCILTATTLSALALTVLQMPAQQMAARQSAAKPIVTLVHDEMPAVDLIGRKHEGAAQLNAPENFRQFSAARPGEPAQTERLTLQFAAATKLTKVETTKDFVVDGGNCVAGRSFGKGEQCALFVRFEPKGAGHRLGKLTIQHTASAMPESIGLGGTGYAPVISFTPASISTVSGTYPSNVGLLSGAQNLAVDGSDSLYVADTGNGFIRYQDSSGVFSTLVNGYPGVYGIAVDTLGTVYFDQPSDNVVYGLSDYGTVSQYSGTSTDNCTYTDQPCGYSFEAVSGPAEMSIDDNNNLFFTDSFHGAALDEVQSVQQIFQRLLNNYPYQETPTGAMAVDTNDNLYTFWTMGGAQCEIVKQTVSNAEHFIPTVNKVAGGRSCGFSGDGGQGGNAEIGSRVGQIAFDLAGNLYFSDMTNHRVRRIDSVTGQINTIAGTGTAGYAGDGGSATKANLSSPTGVGVDSQGEVYIISSATSGQVIRKLGVSGSLNLGSLAVGSASAVQYVTLSNTGNSSLTFTNESFTAGNTTDFSIDPGTTNCNYTTPLVVGQSCKIGFLFKPTVAGARSATFTFADNTVTGLNTIQLAGTGVATGTPAAKLSATSQSFGSITSGTTKTRPFTITNSGGGTLNVTAINTTGANPAAFTHTSNCGGNPLAANALCTVQVTFTPTAAGSFSATMSIVDNATGSPQTVALTGTATAAAVKPKVTLAAKSNPAKKGQKLTFNSKVAASGSKTPTGTVQLKDGSKVIAEKKLSSSAATFTVSTLAKGIHMLTAYYAGDALHASAESSTIKQVVK